MSENSGRGSSNTLIEGVSHCEWRPVPRRGRFDGLVNYCGEQRDQPFPRPSGGTERVFGRESPVGVQRGADELKDIEQHIENRRSHAGCYCRTATTWRRQYRSISNGRKICGPQCWREDLRMNKIAPATARVHLRCIRAGLRER
jgi:hypothetical protein